MKLCKGKRLLISGLAVLTLLVFAAFPAAAADCTVTYEEEADQFVFLPESADLFQNFKGVMPGDTRTQAIVVHNNIKNNVKVKLYLRAEVVEQTYHEFLSKLTMTVRQDSQSVLFDAPAHSQGNLTENVLLGTFESGADIHLDVSLKVPPTLGDDFQQKQGVIKWVFTAEEIPVDNPPPTGETVSRLLWIAGIGLLLSVATLVGLKLFGRKSDSSR